MTIDPAAALARWRDYPPANAKRKPCSYCGRSFTVVCDETSHTICGQYLAKAERRNV